MIKTTFIVLRKTPYQESGLIVAGLSPDCGRLDLIVKGARSIGKKKFPVYALFRELSIQFNEPQGESLASPRSSEPVESFDGVASNPEAYLLACQFAAFMLKHSRPMLGCPGAYEALKTMLRRMSGNEVEPKIAASLAKLAFLQEEGLLPDSVESEETETDERRGKTLNELLLSSTGEGMPPRLSSAYWAKITSWIDSLAAYHGLN